MAEEHESDSYISLVVREQRERNADNLFSSLLLFLQFEISFHSTLAITFMVALFLFHETSAEVPSQAFM